MAAAATAAIPAGSSVPAGISAYEDSQPVLPPRPTGRHHASAAEPAAWWKSWPVMVIILAGIAIVVAIILLVLPGGEKKDAHLIPPPGPAPDRMDTNPLPPNGGSPPTTPGTPGTGNGSAGGTDPWGQHGQIDPKKRTTPDPLPTPIDPADPIPDPFDLNGRGGGLNLGDQGLMFGMFKHACDRLRTCSTDGTITMMCDALKGQLSNVPAPTCAAATRCFSHIDQMTCDDLGGNDPASNPLATAQALMSSLTDCAEAARC